MILQAQGQKNCSIKDEDELAQIIGKYRMTSELHWVEFKGGIDNHLKQTVVKKDSYSSDSLDEFGEDSTPHDTEKNKESSEENYELDMNNEKSLSQSSSDISSVHDNTSITSTYSFEIVEETEALQTENITEAIDIRISPRNSTVMSFNCSNEFYSEFSLVANVEVKLSDENENLEDTKNIIEPEDDSMQVEAETENSNDVVYNEVQTEISEKFSEIQLIDVNANDSIIIENEEMPNDKSAHEKTTQRKLQNVTLESSTVCDPPTPKKTEYYANKIEITKQEKRIASSVEKKIAEEIKAMKEREEDLRAMREKLAKEMSEKAAANKTTISDVPVLPKVEKVPSPILNCDEKPVIKKAATEKIENAYTTARVFAIKRKDVTIKNDTQENNKSASANTKKESPVEREIRIAKEREEELKREREQALKSKLEMDSFNSEFSANETDVDSALSICSDSSFDSVSKLASLFPRTISPEMSNGNGISVYSSSAGSICSLESLSQRERQTNGSQSVGGSVSGSLLSPSPDSAYGKSGTFTSPRISTEKRSKSIDMERFISSKGKEIKFKGNSPVIGLSNYYEIKPPQVKKGEEMTCKRFITAATKIQNELKEMQEREEQFKKERATLKKDTKNGDIAGENEINVHETRSSENDSSPMKMNRPDSLEDLHKSNKKEDNSTNQARRRSVLIDEWEQRIQKSILQP